MHSEPDYCLYELHPQLLGMLAPICAAAQLQLHRCSSPDVGRSGQLRAVFYSLDTLPTHPAPVPVFLLGLTHQLEQLYRAASTLNAHVVVLPQARRWLLAALSQLTAPSPVSKQPEAGGLGCRRIFFAGAHGGAGTSTVATLCALRHAWEGGEVVLVDGSPHPAQGVGISRFLHPPTQAGWEDYAPLSGPVSSARLRSLLPQQQLGQGRLWLLGAREKRVELGAERLWEALPELMRAFATVVVDVGQVDRSPDIVGAEYYLVSQISAEAAAAAAHIHQQHPHWSLVLNGSATKRWPLSYSVEQYPGTVAGRLPRWRQVEHPAFYLRHRALNFLSQGGL